jgi:hypothetical protein
MNATLRRYHMSFSPRLVQIAPSTCNALLVHMTIHPDERIADTQAASSGTRWFPP